MYAFRIQQVRVITGQSKKEIKLDQQGGGFIFGFHPHKSPKIREKERKPCCRIVWPRNNFFISHAARRSLLLLWLISAQCSALSSDSPRSLSAALSLYHCLMPAQQVFFIHFFFCPPVCCLLFLNCWVILFETITLSKKEKQNKIEKSSKSIESIANVKFVKSEIPKGLRITES